MSGDDSSETDGIELSRRTFTKAAGAAAGAGLLGASANTAAADHVPAMPAKFANPRVQELRKVWERGYRGNPNRTIGINDSGIDARHPDLGPWNGVRGIVDGDELKLVDEAQRSITSYDVELMDAVSNPDAFPATAQATPGTFATGQEVEIVQFSTNPGESRFLNAELDWSPSQQNANDLEFRLDERVGDGEWETVSRVATGSVPERILGAKLDPGTTYRFVAETYVNTVSNATVYVDASNSPNSSASGTPSEDLGFYTLDGSEGLISGSPLAVGSATDKTVGWIDAGARYGSLAKPRDPNGHGSHVASIAAGSGRASEIAREVESGPDSGTTTVTLGGSELAVVEVEQGEAGVYASAYGDNIEIEIVGVAGVAASSTITSDASTNDNNTASTPAEPGESYIVRVQAASSPSGASAGGESVSLGQGFNTAGRIDSYSIGTFADPASTSGDREVYADTDDDGAVEDDQVALHSGVAPNTSLVGLQGLSGPVPILADHAETFTDEFNMRAVNMSWGPVGGVPLGVAGGNLDTSGIVSDIGTMADGGLLTVAAAGNAATPANGNGYPAVADEAVSVVATGPKDGIAAYSSGGIGALDEDENATYMKPDVTAPGGTLTDLATAAKADTDPANFDSDAEPQGYTGKAGTSMASPYTCGVAGLVADAMEDAGLIKEPAESDINDVFRLKQVLLATASETAFTAAPYHRAKAPSYQFGDRDPFEGYGRVNPDAAVDAATRNWVAENDDGTEPADASPGEEVNLGFSAGHVVGLDVPEDARAAAGYVDATRGEVTFDLTVGDINGADAGMAAGGHQVDFFVYDLEQPGPHGEPNVLAKAQSVGGGKVQLTVYTDGRGLNPQEQPQSSVASIEVGEGETRRLAVVGKLVNVPGLVNGFEARTDVRFDGSFVAEQLPAFSASGIRSDSGDRFTPGATNRVNIQLDEMDVDEAEIIEKVPKEWDLLEGFGDYESDEQIVDSSDTHNLVSFGTVTEDELPVTRNYAANAPSSSDSYTFGPARVAVETVGDSGPYRNEEATFGGSDPRNIVVGGAPSSGGSSTSGDDTLTGGDDTLADGSDGSSGSDDSTDTIGDTVDGTTGTVDDTTGSL